MKPRRPKLIDVARLASVSPMTASRALRGAATVGSAAKLAVEQAAAQLGYIPNQVAGSLKSSRSGIVAVILPTLTASVFSDTVDGLSNTLVPAGFQLMIGESSYEPAREEQVIAAIIKRRPDAMVVVGTKHTDAARNMLRAATIPIVEVWEQTRHPIDSVVGFSNFDAAFDLAEELISRGRRKFFIATGPMSGGNRAEDRAAGIRAALHKAALFELGQIEVPYETFLRSMTAGGEALLKRYRENPQIDCIVCTNELLALGAISLFTRAGVRVPETVAIAGFGDTEVASMMTPSLTMVRIPGWEMGVRAAEILMARLADSSLAPEVIDLGYEIVWRESA